MSIKDARQKIPNLICETIDGYKCSTILNGGVLEIEVNADENIYSIVSAVTINTMNLIQVASAAKQEYRDADFIDNNTRFIWYFDKEGEANKSILITQNNSYHWFCGSFTSSLKQPDCKSDSVMLVKKLIDNRKRSVWFDKNSPELQKIK